MFSVRFVDLPGRFGQTADAILGTFDVDPFGGHQCLVPIGQEAFGSVRMRSKPWVVRAVSLT